MSEHIPDIETYTKRLNWYLQEHYPANKKITAEEWNALFLALMNQGNAQEETLEKICNEILPPHITAINYLLDKEANHTPRIEALEQVTTNHEGRIDNLEDTTTEYGGRISSLENTVSNHGTRINVLESSSTDYNHRITELEDTTHNHSTRIDILENSSTDHNYRITELEDTTHNHGTRIDVLEVDAIDSKTRIGTLENTTRDHDSRIQVLEVAEINHENRISDLENLTNEHSSEISDLDTLTQTHTTQISGLRTDVDSNINRIGTLEDTILQKAFKTETTLKYNVSNIPSAITYAKNGIKDLLIEFYNEEYVVPVAPDTTAYRKGSVIVVSIEEVNDNLVQTEIFKFKEGIVTRQITSNNGTIIAISDWKPINNAYLTDLDNRVDTNTTEIANIKRDYATNTTVNAKETTLQNQITTNRTDIDALLSDYVKRADNLNIDYLTKNELSVSDTGALIQTERLKNITKNAASNPRQTTPIPVVDNKARLFLPQEIASLRDLVSWKNSLIGEALSYLVDFSDFPLNPSQSQLQEYLNNKWTSIGGTTPIIDQTTMTDESIPLSYRWYVNENAWIYSHGVSDNLATNNLYNEQGTLVTPGSTGKVLGSNKKFHIMYETNGEGAVVGLDALEQDVLNNTADITDVNTDLSTYKTSNNTRVSNVESRATALETRATTIEGILPTKLDKISNTLNMQGLYGRKADGTHNLLGADSANTVGSVMLRDLNGNAHIGTPTSNTHIANKKYVDDADAALNTAISNLTTTVNGIDTRYQDITDTIASNLANETTARTNADTALQNSITSLTNNKMDKANPTGTGTFNLTGLMVPTDGIKLNTLSKAFKLYGDDQSNNIFFEVDGTNYFKLIDDSGKLYSENHEVARKDYVGTGTLTMQLNGTNVDTFSANASTNKTINIKALPNFNLNIGNTGGGNPRPTLFVTVDYNNFTSESGAYFKLSATGCHGNGVAYAFLEDIIIGVHYTGAITCNVYKYAQTSCGTYQGADRHYGDIFYVHDSTAKTVKFYVLLGQYSSAQFTPATKIGLSRAISTANGITQHTGTPTYYSSGDIVWATGNDTTYARLSDIPEVVQSTGTDTTKVMSQKSTTDSLNGKIDWSAIKQSTGTGENVVMSQKAITDELTAILTTLSNKFTNHPQSAYNCNTCYDEGVYLIANGSNCPSGSQYGSLFVMPYRKPTGNTKPDFCIQIFLPNGDDSASPNKMFYRTSLADSWNSWQSINNPTITIRQDGITKGSFTLNQSDASTIELSGGLDSWGWEGSNGSKGYIRFSNGFQIVWGKVYNKNTTYSYAMPFKDSSTYSVAGVSTGWTGSYGNYGMGSLTATGFYLNSDKDYTWSYIAVGFWQ